jgi:hypothetical protein
MAGFVSLDGLFAGRHFDREIIILFVRWYLRFKRFCQVSRQAGHGDRDEGDEELRWQPAVALARPPHGLPLGNRAPASDARRNHAAPAL